MLLVAPSDVTMVLGGLERHVLALARKLGKAGHQVAIAVPSRRSGRRRLGEGVELVRLRALFPSAGHLYRALAVHPQFPDPALVLSLRRFIKQWQPEVVHSHGLVLFSVGPALWGSGIPWVHTLHDYGLICPKGSLWRLPVGAICREPLTLACIACHGQEEPKGPLSPVRAVGALAALAVSASGVPKPDLLIAVGQFVAEAHRSVLPALATRLTVIPNFVGAEKGGAPPEGLPQRFVLFVGSGLPYKGLHILLRAFRALPRGVRLVVMASGRAKWLDGLLRGADARTVFYYNVPHTAVLAAWERCLFGVIPSLWPEPCPTVALEAMSKGKPVVACATGGLLDIVADGETGILVPPGDVKALRLALRRLLEDETLRQRMGQAAWQRFREQFSAEGVVPAIAMHYSRLRQR